MLSVFCSRYWFPETAVQVFDRTGIRARVGLVILDFPTNYAKCPPDYFSKASHPLLVFTIEKM